MLSNTQVMAAVALLLDDEEETVVKRKRTVWVRPWMTRTETDGAFYTIFRELKEEDSEGFRGYLRLDTNTFDKLVNLLTTSLAKNDTVMRKCIKPEEMCCLRYFASGESFHSLEYQFRISRKAITYIVEEVALAIIKVLGQTYLQTPKTSGEWLKISEKFKKRWNFPNGIGGVDGKHIVLQQPRNSGSHYRNYKGTYSIISIAMVGSEYGFLFADVGVNGRNSDGGNWSQSTLRKGLEEKTLNLPIATQIHALEMTHSHYLFT